MQLVNQILYQPPTEISAEVLVANLSEAGPQQWYEGNPKHSIRRPKQARARRPLPARSFAFGDGDLINLANLYFSGQGVQRRDVKDKFRPGSPSHRWSSVCLSSMHSRMMTNLRILGTRGAHPQHVASLARHAPRARLRGGSRLCRNMRRRLEPWHQWLLRSNKRVPTLLHLRGGVELWRQVRMHVPFLRWRDR